MTDEIDRIVAGLSEAEAKAICGIYAWANPIDEDRGETRLCQLGLWNPRPKWGEKAITPLGLAVRNRLQENSRGD